MFGFHTRQWYLDQQTAYHQEQMRLVTEKLEQAGREKDALLGEISRLQKVSTDSDTERKRENRLVALSHAVDVTPGSDPSSVLKAAGLFDTYLERGSTLPTYAPDGKLTQRAVVTIAWGSLKYRLERLILDGMNRAPRDLTEDILEILKNDAEVEVIDIDEAPKVQPRPIRDNPQA